MKIAIQNSARVWGGNEKWMLAVARGLMERGHDVIVSCREGGEVARRMAAAGARVSGVRPGAALALPRAMAFARWLRRERPDVLLLTSWKGTFAGARAAHAAGMRVVVRLGIVRTPRRPWEALAFRRWVDAMIVNAPEIREAWTRDAPYVPPARIHVILNGIETAPVDRAAARRRLLHELGADDDALLIAGAGHVSRRKGFDLLIDAFARAEVPGARLVIAGAGPELPALRRQADERGIAARLRWLGHRDDMPAVLAGCGLFVLSSRNEGMANVMLEAMAVGTPVVAADVSGVRTALGPGADGAAAGWIVPPDDAAALADALREVAARLRDDPAAVQARADEALRRVERAFGVGRMVDEVEAVLGGAEGTPHPVVRPWERVAGSP